MRKINEKYYCFIDNILISLAEHISPVHKYNFTPNFITTLGNIFFYRFIFIS